MSQVVSTVIVPPGPVVRTTIDGGGVASTTISNPAITSTILGVPGPSGADDATLPIVLENSTITTQNATGAVALNPTTNNRFDLTLTGNTTLSVTADFLGSSIMLRVGASAYTITWSVTGLKWPNGTAPTLPTTSGRYMLIALVRWGTNDWTGTATPEIY